MAIAPIARGITNAVVQRKAAPPAGARANDRRRRNQLRSKNKVGQSARDRTARALPTIDEEFNQRYEDPYAAETTPLKNRKNSALEQQLLAVEQAFLQSLLRTYGNGTEKYEFSATGEGLRLGSYIIISLINRQIYRSCSFIFLAQVACWVMSVVGFMLAAAVLGLAELFDVIFLGWLVETIGGNLIPGKALFFIFTILAAFCGWAQLAIAYAAYEASKVAGLKIHPFSGASQVWFMVAAAMYWLPFIGGIAPWGILWTRSVKKTRG